MRGFPFGSHLQEKNKGNNFAKCSLKCFRLACVSRTPGSTSEAANAAQALLRLCSACSPLGPAVPPVHFGGDQCFIYCLGALKLEYCVVAEETCKVREYMKQDPSHLVIRKCCAWQQVTRGWVKICHCLLVPLTACTCVSFQDKNKKPNKKKGNN